MTVITATIASSNAGSERSYVGHLVVTPARTPADFTAWSRYIGHTPAATIFHDPIWAEAVEETFGHRGRHLLVRRDDHVVGVLPLMEVHSLFGGRMLVSMPYGTYGGVLANDTPARTALGATAIRLVHECGANVLDLRSAEAALPDLETVERYDAFIRELPDKLDGLDPFLPKRARAAARQAHEKYGVEVEHNNEQLPAVWRLYSRSMRRLGSLSYPYRFFTRLVERLGERAWITVARHNGRIIAGTLSLVCNGTVTPYILGLDERDGCPGATNLLYYKVMQRAIGNGLRHFDYGRTRKDNPGSAGFKKNQGFKPRTLGYQRYVPAGNKAPDLTPSNRRFSLARRIWPWLPLPLTRCLGGWLAKSIPG